MDKFNKQIVTNTRTHALVFNVVTNGRESCNAWQCLQWCLLVVYRVFDFYAVWHYHRLISVEYSHPSISGIMAMQAAGHPPKTISLLHSCLLSQSMCEVAWGRSNDWIYAFGCFLYLHHTLIELSLIPFHCPSQFQQSSRVSRGTGVCFINMETFSKYCICIPLCRLSHYKEYRQCTGCRGGTGYMRVLIYFKSNNTGACSKGDK